MKAAIHYFKKFDEVTGRRSCGWKHCCRCRYCTHALDSALILTLWTPDLRKSDTGCCHWPAQDLSGYLDHKEFILMCHAMKWDAKNTAMSLLMLDKDGDGKVGSQPPGCACALSPRELGATLPVTRRASLAAHHFLFVAAAASGHFSSSAQLLADLACVGQSGVIRRIPTVVHKWCVFLFYW